MSAKGRIGVDFDGTLASYNGWDGYQYTGDPIRPMIKRVQRSLEEGAMCGYSLRASAIR